VDPAVADALRLPSLRYMGFERTPMHGDPYTPEW